MKFAAGIIKNHVSNLTLLLSVIAPFKDVFMRIGLRRIWKEIVVASFNPYPTNVEIRVSS